MDKVPCEERYDGEGTGRVLTPVPEEDLKKVEGGMMDSYGYVDPLKNVDPDFRWSVRTGL